MPLIKRTRGTLGAVAIVVVAACACSCAWLGVQDESPTTPQAQSDDLFTAGRSIFIKNDIGGDVGVAGEDVSIEGQVDGYVMSAGRRVTLVGKVGNDLWAAGQTVNVDSAVTNNAFLAGNVIHLRPDSVVGHDARLAGNTVTAEGRIERNLRVGADVVNIGADVGGSVEARASRVTLTPDAIIRGDLNVRSAHPPEISAGARVLGQVHYQEVKDSDAWFIWPRRWLLYAVALLILGGVALAFSPGWATRVTTTMRRRTGASFMSGLFLLLLVPLVVGILAATIVGVPLAVVLLALYMLVVALSSVFVSYRAGEWMLARWPRVPAARWMRLILGVAVVSLAMSLPAVGWAFAAAIIMTGTGALVLERRDQRARLDSLGLA